jgi:hypothetical protein
MRRSWDNNITTGVRKIWEVDGIGSELCSVVCFDISCTEHLDFTAWSGRT